MTTTISKEIEELLLAQEIDIAGPSTEFEGINWEVYTQPIIPPPDVALKRQYYPKVGQKLEFKKQRSGKLKINIIGDTASIEDLSFSRVTSRFLISNKIEIGENTGDLSVKAIAFITETTPTKKMRSIAIFKDSNGTYTFGDWLCKS